MPILLQTDVNGNTFYSYGLNGKPYYFKTILGARRAYQKAAKQGRAISISKARSKGHYIPPQK